MHNQTFPKLYVIVDRNLSSSHRAVQACHAVAQFQLDHPETDWKNHSLVLLGVDGHLMLEYYLDLFTGLYDVSGFKEPHWHDRLTAVAATDVSSYLKDLSLL